MGARRRVPGQRGLYLRTILFLLLIPTAGPAAQSTDSVAASGSGTTRGVTDAERWRPAPGLRWQVQYEGALDLGVAADVFVLDLFDTPDALVAELKNSGKRVACYLNAGAWEAWRPDRRFPRAVLGKAMKQWKGERWLDLRRLDLLAPIMAARLEMCRGKRFDGVLFDNVDGHTNDTGFPLTPSDQLRYNTWLANAARARGLGAGMNNNSIQARELEAYFDWAQAESCFAEGWCAQLAPFVRAGKAVLAIEYTDTRIDLAKACARAMRSRIDVIVKNRNLDAFRQTCRR